MTDTHGRKTHALGGVKANVGKPPVDLLPSRALLAVAEVLGFGAEKYSPHNWRLGMSWSDTVGSIERHLLAFNDGEDLDQDSQLHHVAHAAAQSLYLLEFVLTGHGEDDRFNFEEAQRARQASDAPPDAPCWQCSYDKQNHGPDNDHNWTPVPKR